MHPYSGIVMIHLKPNLQQSGAHLSTFIYLRVHVCILEIIKRKSSLNNHKHTKIRILALEKCAT